MKLSEQTKGYLATIAVTLIIGLAFLFAKKALAHSSVWDMLTHRFILAWIVILPFAIYKRKELKVTRGELPSLLLMALLYPILIFGLQLWGLVYTSSAEAGIIQAVQPLLTIGLAVFLLKEKITFRQKLFAILSVSGVIFIFVMQGVEHGESFLGYLLQLSSCTFLALYFVSARKYKNRYSVFKLTFFCLTIGAFFFSLFSFGMYKFSDNYTLGFFQAFYSMEYVVAILYLGIFSSLLTLVLTNYSYARVEASKLGIFGNFVPVVAIFAGVIVMGDSLSWSQIVGTVFILAGVIGVNVAKEKNVI